MTADERSLKRLRSVTPFDDEMLFERDLYGQEWVLIARFKDKVLLRFHQSQMLVWAEVVRGSVVEITPVAPEDRHATTLRYHWRLPQHHRQALLESVRVGTHYDPEFGGIFENNGRVSWQRFGPEALDDGDQRHTTLLQCRIPARSAVVAVDVNDAELITKYTFYEREPAYTEWRRLVEAQRNKA